VVAAHYKIKLTLNRRLTHIILYPFDAIVARRCYTQHFSRCVDAEGRSLELREDASYDSASRVLQLDWRLLRKQSCGSVILVRMRQYVGQYTAADVDRLLKRAGLTALARFGDVDRSPYTARSKEQVVICGCRSEGGRNSLKGPSAL
jgi:hypothetical protein